MSNKTFFNFAFLVWADKISKLFIKGRPVENITPKFLIIIIFSVEETLEKKLNLGFTSFVAKADLIKTIPWLLSFWASSSSFLASKFPVSVCPLKFLAV